MNELYYGDNLEVLRRYISSESVTLVYLDPPFKSNQDYNVLFAEHDGTRSAAQIKAFEDTWEWDQSAAEAYQEVVEWGGKVSRVMQAFHVFLGPSDVLAYLAMMAPRLVELRRVLKPAGSIYLHCDPTASHYLKLLLDAIFGPLNFRNEIIWKRTTAHSSAKKYAPIHDTLLYYGKSDACLWNSPRIDYEDSYLDKYYRFEDGDGRLYWRADLCAAGVRRGRSGMPWRGIDPTDKGMHWKFTVEKLDELDAAGRIYWPARGTMPQYKRYRDELKGKTVPDLWDDIDRINPVGGERLGYPTQKPVALLERIIQASSNAEDMVLDPFCGCGTAIEAAQKLNRRWIGIDATHLAISLIKSRLKSAFGDGIEKSYAVTGEPTSLPDAENLARNDPYQFQWWALGLVGARPVEQKKGADKGIDGRLYFHDDRKSGQTKQIIFSVKAGHITVSQLRDLRGVVEREKAQMGVLITMEEPTRPMKTGAAGAGFYDSPWGSRHPRLQIRTIEELLEGKGVDRPPHDGNVTFKKAPRVYKKQEEQPELL
jgi:DNA modification methylase